MTVPKAVLDALARAPVDTEPLPSELEAEIDQRLAEVRSGVVELVAVDPARLRRER